MSQVSAEKDFGKAVGEPATLNQVELAQRIKKLRLDRGLTIDDAATRSGFTSSWWSKVESFRITPSLPALFRLTATLGTSISKLFEGLDVKPQLVVVAPEHGLKFRRDPEISDIEYESLAHARPNRRMDPLLLTIAPGGGRSKSLPHEGEEFLIVLQGQVVLEYGEQRVDLPSGYSAYFDSTVEHRLQNPFEHVAKVLCVFEGMRSVSE